MKNIFSLKNKEAIVTGGAGYLGSAITKGLLDFGAEVVVADIINENIEYSFVEKEKENPYTIYCDVSKSESIKEMFKRVKDILGKIDILINCAFFGEQGKIEDMSDDAWDKGIDGTIGATFRCTREVIPHMIENKHGIIINISSMYGIVSPDPRIYGLSGQNNPANYGAGKSAVLQFTRYCAAHLANKNIRVNSITPGPFPNLSNNPPEEFINNLISKTMLGRIGKPEDIVGPIILLSSESSCFMTGANIIVDGGWTAW